MKPHLLTAGATGLLVLVTAAGCTDDPDPATTPTGPATTPAALPTSAAALSPGQIRLLQPVDKTDVKQCAILNGEANLPEDKTLIIGVRNMDNGSAERYFAAVEDWEYPTDLNQWQGVQYFGSKDSAAGQDFRVEVLLIGLEQTRKAIAASSKQGWHSTVNPPGSKVVAHITLHRVPGPGPASCT